MKITQTINSKAQSGLYTPLLLKNEVSWEEICVSIFSEVHEEWLLIDYPEDGGKKFFQNVCT